MKSFQSPLNALEEQQYLQQLEAGSEDARKILIERNMRLVAHIAKKYQNMEEEIRTCVILFYYQDLSTREIEKITGIKRSTVEFRLKEARKLLRGSLKGVV